jgi:serine/threonine protein kinase
MKETLVGGHYWLLEMIGSGGEARVFRATDTVTEAEVALRLALGPVTQRAQAASADYHEGWVRLLDAGTDPQHGTYQVFELLKGRTLDESVQSGPLTPGDWHLFVDQSLSAVEALHGAGWVHGDLNAQNFLHAGQEKKRWKLLELPFQRFDPAVPRSAAFGSIHTLAPEQIDGKQPDARSDLYALGCLYYYAASGGYPHPGDSFQEVAIHCLRFAPDPLAAKAPGLPAAWSEWVMKLLARDPANRFPSASAACQVLGVA